MQQPPSDSHISAGNALGIAVPELHSAPVFYPAGTRLIWISGAGEIDSIDRGEAALRLRASVPVICHRRWSEARAGTEIEACLDVMELFAFVRPARFCLPTPRGLAAQLSLPMPNGAEDMAALLPRAAFALLDELAAGAERPRREAGAIATMMTASGWPWGPIVLAHLGLPPPPNAPPDGRMASIFGRLPEYNEFSATPPPGSTPIPPDAARDRLGQMLGDGSELRESQADYAAALAAGFDRPDAGPLPAMVLAEAGTGTGKTLGYLAPATLWAETNGAPVWISTYTRTLQHQIASELTRLYPDATSRARKVVIRKGRENYLCLLNLEEALGQLGGAPRRGTALGLMARWAGATGDGDLTGPTFPAWLTDLAGRAQTIGLADRRGECIHSACAHYNRCFVEKSTRRARRADIVISNHALVMINAAYAPPVEAETDRRRPTRYVFDEGHHLFDAADSAFSVYLSAQESAELRNWIRGAEDGRRGRARGLKRRIGELLADHPAALADLDSALEAARGDEGAQPLPLLRHGVPGVRVGRLRARCAGDRVRVDADRGLSCDACHPGVRGGDRDVGGQGCEPGDRRGSVAPVLRDVGRGQRPGREADAVYRRIGEHDRVHRALAWLCGRDHGGVCCFVRGDDARQLDAFAAVHHRRACGRREGNRCQGAADPGLDQQVRRLGRGGDDGSGAGAW